MIPIVDLKRQYQSLKPEIDAAVAKALENATFILGPDVAAFEQEFAAYSGAGQGIGVNSGTSALHLALLAAGVGPGDEVITVPFTFIATAAAVRYAGARPVFVDIDAATFNIDPALIEAAITPRTKAILPVHLFGQCADMDPILDVARRHNLAVIEDAAQAHGAEYKGRRAGSIAMACFSFYPGKNLGAYGEGGMVTTSDPDLAAKIRKMRDWGGSKRYYHDIAGFNYRLEGLQGAILRAKFPHLDRWTEARRRNAARYTELLAGTGIVTPVEMPYAKHVFHCYVIRVAAERDRRVEQLTEAGIGTGVYYPVPIHLQEAYADLGYRRGQFPVSEQLADEVIALPVHPDLTEAEVETVARAVRSFAQ